MQTFDHDGGRSVTAGTPAKCRRLISSRFSRQRCQRQHPGKPEADPNPEITASDTLLKMRITIAVWSAVPYILPSATVYPFDKPDSYRVLIVSSPNER